MIVCDDYLTCGDDEFRSDIIAHANPGQSAQKDALGQIHAFLHDRKVDKGLTRRVRNHFNHHYRAAGTTINLYEKVFALLPYDIKTVRFVACPNLQPCLVLRLLLLYLGMSCRFDELTKNALRPGACYCSSVLG